MKQDKYTKSKIRVSAKQASRLIRAGLFGLLIIISPVFLKTRLSCFAAQQYAGAASYLQFGGGSASLGAGRTGTGATADISSVYHNPAGIAGIDKTTLFLEKDNMQADRNLNIFSAALPFGKGVLGLSYIRYGVDNIMITQLDPSKQLDLNGNPVYDIKTTGWFNDSQSTLALAYGGSLHERLNIGFTLKNYVHKALDASAQGWGFDAGILFKFRKNLNFGFSLKDAGGELNWDTASGKRDKIPYQAALGASWNWKNRITALLDIVSIQEKRAKINLGVHAVLAEALVLRTGLNDGRITAGIGLNVAKDSSIDAAYIDEEFGSSYRLSATVCFDSFRKKSKKSGTKKLKKSGTKKLNNNNINNITDKNINNFADNNIENKTAPGQPAAAAKQEKLKKPFSGWLHYSKKSYKINKCLYSAKGNIMMPLESLVKPGLITVQKNQAESDIMSIKILKGSAADTLVSFKLNDCNFLVNNSKWTMLKTGAVKKGSEIMISGAELFKALDENVTFEKERL
jgi:hypothetical protein